MDLYTKFVSTALFPLHERIKGHSTLDRFRELEKSQWADRADIEKFRNSRLQDFMVGIARDVVFYSDLFRNIGVDPRNIQRPTDLAMLPLLDKATVRANVEKLKSRNANGLARYNTGGSSGEPLVFFIGEARRSHDVAAKWRATRWWGVDIGDPEVVVWGSPIELSGQDRVRSLRDALLRSRLLPAFDMSNPMLDKFIEKILRWKPRMLFGYPSALSLIAMRAESKGMCLADCGLRVVFCTSERLYDHQRNLIQRVFGCPVANGYGARDAGFIAHECPHGGMHISAEDVIVEIVDTNGAIAPQGESGEIVVTHLATQDFPFVRYRTGDIGVLDHGYCGCGRQLPMLKNIEGRTTDFVTASDGTVMHGLSLIYVLRDIVEIASFKIVQESTHRLVVKLVANIGFNDSVGDKIRRELQGRLGRDVVVEIELVDMIAPEASGKFRYVTSKVPLRCAD